MKKPRGFMDLARLPEDDRIDFMADAIRAAVPGLTIGVTTDSYPLSKRQIYLDKLTKACGQHFTFQGFFEGPVRGAVTLKLLTKAPGV